MSIRRLAERLVQGKKPRKRTIASIANDGTVIFTDGTVAGTLSPWKLRPGDRVLEWYGFVLQFKWQDATPIMRGSLFIPYVFAVDHYAMYLHNGGTSPYQSGLSYYDRTGGNRLFRGTQTTDISDTLYHMHVANYNNNVYVTAWDGELHRFDMNGIRQYDYIYSFTGTGVNYNLTRSAYQVEPTININYTGWHQVTINRNGLCVATGPNVGFYLFDLNQIVEGPWEYGKYSYKCLSKIGTLVGPGGVHLTDDNKLYLATNYLTYYGGSWRYYPAISRYDALTGTLEYGPVNVAIDAYIEDLCVYNDIVYLSDRSLSAPKIHRYTDLLVPIDTWDLSELGMPDYPLYGDNYKFRGAGISVNKDGIWFAASNMPSAGYDSFKYHPDEARTHLVNLNFDYSVKRLVSNVGWHMDHPSWTVHDKEGDFHYLIGCDTLQED